MLSYFLLLVTAGNETTRNATSGGLQAFIDTPDLAVGVGEHFCLGANLARLELEVIFRALLKHVEYVGSTGPLERLASNFVGGIKRMPVRMKLRPHPM